MGPVPKILQARAMRSKWIECMVGKAAGGGAIVFAVEEVVEGGVEVVLGSCVCLIDDSIVERAQESWSAGLVSVEDAGTKLYPLVWVWASIIGMVVSR